MNRITYNDSAGRIRVIRHKDIADTMVSFDLPGSTTVTLWLTNEEIAALAYMARNAHHIATLPVKEAA